MANFDYDIIVIGGGAGGFSSSKTAAGFGKKVAVIEKDKLGGECTWSGCVPSKRLIHIAGLFADVNEINELGLAQGTLTPDTGKVMENVRDTIDAIYQTHTPEIFEKSGIKVFIGSPRFVDKHTVLINDKKVTAGKFILCTGSSPTIPPIKGLDNVSYLTNQNIFALEKIPESMLTLGSGPIGLEISQSFVRLGSKVTVVHRSDQILKNDDIELTSMLKQRLIDDGLNILSQHSPVEVMENNGKIVTTLKNKSGELITIETDAIFVATGRKPNLSGLELDKAGIKYDKKGIHVNSKMETSCKNIYACGDIVPPFQFSHVSEMEGVAAGINASIPLKRKVNYDSMVWITFTSPELAHLGMTEEEARAKYGNNIIVQKYDYSSLDRAKTDGATFGMAKLILHKNGRIVGAHILGKNAGELIHQAQLIKFFNKRLTDINSILYAYPSLSDLVRNSSKKAYIWKLQNNIFLKIIKKIFS